MNCETALQQLVLVQYGELPDELQFSLEQHVEGCEDCRREWNAMLLLQEELALDPVLEPSPNLLTAARVRLDEALDALPPRTLGQRITANAFRWFSFVQSAPALATLLVGAGFLGGHYLGLYQAATHASKLPPSVVMQNTAESSIASVSGIVETPNSQLVQVNYTRMVPETMQGSLDSPEIRDLLMLGTKLATTNDVHATSVALLAGECRAGHECGGDDTQQGIRGQLMVNLRYDKSAAVRLKALEGLQPYVASDQNVRDAVLAALVHDASPNIREQAVSMLQPVGADSSVRQVLRTVSSQDVNPAIRNASFQVLQSASDIQ
jgi:hypothetical protein